MRNRVLFLQCYRKESKIISLYIYVYIYRERERERNKKREKRGEEEAPPPETTGESQRHNDSDGVSESENKRQEKTLKVKCFMDSKKKSRPAHLLDRPRHATSHRSIGRRGGTRR